MHPLLMKWCKRSCLSNLKENRISINGQVRLLVALYRNCFLKMHRRGRVLLRVGLRIMNIQRKKLNNGTLLENLLKTLILAIGNMEI